jgi:hypothetical protein
VRKYDGTVTATLQTLTVFQRIGLISGVTSFGLPGGNDAISGRRPDNSIENVKKYGRKYDSQNDVHRYPPMVKLSRMNFASLLHQYCSLSR